MSDFDVMPTVDFNINKQMYYIISWEYLVQGSSGSMKKNQSFIYACILATIDFQS